MSIRDISRVVSAEIATTVHLQERNKIRLPTEVKIVEVGPRDGLQNEAVQV